MKKNLDTWTVQIDDYEFDFVYTNWTSSKFFLGQVQGQYDERERSNSRHKNWSFEIDYKTILTNLKRFSVKKRRRKKITNWLTNYLLLLFFSYVGLVLSLLLFRFWITFWRLTTSQHEMWLAECSYLCQTTEGWLPLVASHVHLSLFSFPIHGHGRMQFTWSRGRNISKFAVSID